MANTQGRRTHHRVRLQKTSQGRCGRVIEFLESLDYDLSREIELLLEIRFLPSALMYAGDDVAAKYAAYESIGQLEGQILAIRYLCNLESVNSNSANCSELQQIENAEDQPVEATSNAADASDADDSEEIESRISISERMFGM